MIPFSPCFLWRRDAPLTKRVFSAVSHIYLPKATKEMVGHIVKFAFHVGDYCPGEYEIARKYRSGGWNEKSYLRKLIKAANAEAVFSDD